MKTKKRLKKYIVNLKELNDKLENNSNLKEPIQLSNYKGKNFNIKPKDILIEKMDEKEKVYQPKKEEHIKYNDKQNKNENKLIKQKEEILKSQSNQNQIMNKKIETTKNEPVKDKNIIKPIQKKWAVNEEQKTKKKWKTKEKR